MSRFCLYIIHKFGDCFGVPDSKDEVKVVIASRRDYEWAREAIAAHGIASRCEVLLSPAWGDVEPRDLVAWMLEDHVPARFQLQLHKVVWGKDTQGV